MQNPTVSPDPSPQETPRDRLPRALREHDILVDIRYSGVCHSDIHQIREDWGPQRYPQVPGHEIAGIVEAVGDRVTRFQLGDRIGVGSMVGHRGDGGCKHGEEQYCPGTLHTYGYPDPPLPNGDQPGWVRRRGQSGLGPGRRQEGSLSVRDRREHDLSHTKSPC